MKENELRFGNTVYYEGVECEVKGIKKDCLIIKHPESYTFSQTIAVKIEAVEPIPLTEECLKKAEFKHYMFFDGLWRFIYKSENRGVAFYIDDVYVCDLKYVHQLQNLYFALCGEECL